VVVVVVSNATGTATTVRGAEVKVRAAEARAMTVAEATVAREETAAAETVPDVISGMAATVVTGRARINRPPASPRRSNLPDRRSRV
jgi:hypothetical protein